MDVLILTEGGMDIGFGHVTRCMALYEAFKERGIEPNLIVQGDKSLNKLLKDRRCRLFNWLEQKRKLKKIVNKKDIVIIDSYLASLGIYKYLSRTAGLGVYIDDYKRLDYPKGIVINTAIYAEGIDYPRKKGITYLQGNNYVCLRKGFWDVPLIKIKKGIKKIMITFGGDDYKKMTPKVLTVLKKEYPNIKKIVIIGAGFRNKAELSALKDGNINLIYNPSVDKMKRAMLDSDIAISAGGQSLNELARVGLPTIGIAVSENQLKNVEGWRKAGFLEYAGWCNDRGLIKKLIKSIRCLEDEGIRRVKSEIGRGCIDGKGSQRITKILLSDFFKKNISLRKAVLKDATDVFNLSNDEAVRSCSFRPKKIRWSEHIKWFKEKINSDNHVFLIVESKGRFIGQVRFSIDSHKKEAAISVSLVKFVRGLGLSSFILDKIAKEMFMRHGKTIRSIKAYVRNENLFSIRAFKKANFRYFADTVIKGRKAKVYIRTN